MLDSAKRHGHLITKAFSSPERGKAYLRVAANHALAAAETGSMKRGSSASAGRSRRSAGATAGQVNQASAATWAPARRQAVNAALAGAVASRSSVLENGGNRPRGQAGLGGGSRVTGPSAIGKEKDFGLAVLGLVETVRACTTQTSSNRS